MSKRKGAADVLSEVEESKKSKPGASLPPRKAGEESPESMEETKESSEDEMAECPADLMETKQSPYDNDYMQIVVSGDGGCGKTCLVLSFLGQPFPPRQINFLSKQYLHAPEGCKFAVMIWDLDSSDNFIEYRRQSYQEADVMFLCFDIKVTPSMGDANDRLDRLVEPWLAELRANNRNTPVILVALKCDQINDSHPERHRFTMEEVQRIRDRHPEIVSYHEVSAHLNRGVNLVFAQAMASINVPTAKIMFSNCGYRIIDNPLPL